MYCYTKNWASDDVIRFRRHTNVTGKCRRMDEYSSLILISCFLQIYIYFWVSVFDYNHYHHFNPKLYNYHLRVKEELLDIFPPCFPCSNPLPYALNSTCFYAEYKAAEKQLQRQDNVATILCVSHTSLFFRFISRQRANSFAQQFVFASQLTLPQGWRKQTSLQRMVFFTD